MLVNRIVKTITVLLLLISVIAIVTSSTIPENEAVFESDDNFDFSFSRNVTHTGSLTLNTTHMVVDGITTDGFNSTLIIGTNGNLSINADTRVDVGLHSFDMTNVNGSATKDSGYANLTFKLKPDTTYDYTLNGASQGTKTTNSDGLTWINLTSWSTNDFTLSESDSTPNYPPAVNDLIVEVFEPDYDNSVSVNVSDENTVGNITEVSCVFFRNSTTYDAENNATEHYTATYFTSNDTIVTDPSGYASVTDHPNQSLTADWLNFTMDFAYYTLPSQSTDNATVNDYVWNVTCSATDDNSTDYLSTETEMNTLVSLSVNLTSVSVDLTNRGTSALFEPNILYNNTGNVIQNITFSATNFTSNGDILLADNLTFDNDGERDNGGEISYSWVTQNYTTPLYPKYSGKSTLVNHNWLYWPVSVPSGQYSGTITLGGVECDAV